LVRLQSDHWKEHLLFRDFLRAHPLIARRYYELKKKMAVKYGSDRIGYTDSKTSFIESVISRARQRAA
ncbi:MAG: GrpB family protein, partial [Anaerolineae bacterium]|nr:GrpB family protein [Anaerolineae bacterium]NIN97363.1 GrpB family protein [Anaerolineae bacterium]NIQ78381.1 GrpB family protein [Anaerolineae bacterium]